MCPNSITVTFDIFFFLPNQYILIFCRWEKPNMSPCSDTMNLLPFYVNSNIHNNCMFIVVADGLLQLLIHFLVFTSLSGIFIDCALRRFTHSYFICPSPVTLAYQSFDNTLCKYKLISSFILHFLFSKSFKYVTSTMVL